MRSRRSGLCTMVLSGMTLAGAGCGSSGGADAGADGGNPAGASDPQTPPTTGRAAMRAWIQAGHYRSWRCEAMPHPQRDPSPHGMNRICSNNLLSGATGATYPVGAASVKELYSMSGMLEGYAVYVKVREGTDGSNWYWYEIVPPGTMLPVPNPVEPDGIVADGFGNAGNARAVCVGCHSGASRATPPGRDFVFTQVR